MGLESASINCGHVFLFKLNASADEKVRVLSTMIKRKMTNRSLQGLERDEVLVVVYERTQHIEGLVAYESGNATTILSVGHLRACNAYATMQQTASLRTRRGSHLHAKRNVIGEQGNHPGDGEYELMIPEFLFRLSTVLLCTMK